MRDKGEQGQDRDADIVDRAIASRRSVRGFLPDPVPLDTVRRILEIASRAPSGSNTQPWKVHVLTGEALRRMTAEMVAAYRDGVPETPEYDYYPTVWRSPYLERRRELGWSLYSLTGVARGDREAGNRQRGRNYDFFGAPVGLVFALDRDLNQGSWLDLGMFLQNIMVVARGRGLDTCPQAAIGNYPAIVRRQLGIRHEEILVGGMALGLADPAEPANELVSSREPVAGFCTFHEA